MGLGSGWLGPPQLTSGYFSHFSGPSFHRPSPHDTPQTHLPPSSWFTCRHLHWQPSALGGGDQGSSTHWHRHCDVITASHCASWVGRPVGVGDTHGSGGQWGHTGRMKGHVYVTVIVMGPNSSCDSWIPFAFLDWNSIVELYWFFPGNWFSTYFHKSAC